ncbi:MAG: hypothetical protein IJE46_03735 [Clostridia bacterium]|nr:hypothetical protein [Clostridia bacterium]
MKKFMEDEIDEFDGSRENFESWLNSYLVTKGTTSDNISDDGNRRASVEDGSIHSGQQASDGKRTDGGSTENSKDNLTVNNEGNIPNKNSLKTKIKYSPTGIKLPSNEYAKFHSSTSTDYYKAYKTHEGLQYQSCVTDDTHILYIYEDGGFGKYNVVARVDYKYGDVATKIMEVLNNEKHYQITGVVNYILETFEVRRSGYTVYNTYTKKRISSRGDGTLFEGTQESHAGRVDASSSGISGNKREAGVNGNTDRGVNENASYSLKQWHTGLSKPRAVMVENWIRRAGSPESKRIAKDTYWYSGRLDGRDLLVLYSTENADSPTILYLARGKKAKVELNSLLNYMEDFESGKRKRFVRKSEIADKVLGGDWLQKKHSMAHNNDRSGKRGSNTGYASVLQGKSSKLIGSPAFRNVIEDCFRIQERDGGVNKNHSLKGGIQNPSKWTKEFLDTIEDVRDGKKNAESRLYKYVEDGTLSTKDYDELIEKYGAIPSGERPHREVQVPRKTADGKKVSQTVRTILEAKATPDEAVPTIEKMVEDGIFSYDAYTDKQAIKDAEDYLKEYGWEKSYKNWFNDVEKGIVSKQHTAMGWALYNNAANTVEASTSESERKTAVRTSLEILDAMAKHQRSAAQALQATRILKKLSPETQLYGVQKSVQALQKELIDRYGNRAPDLKIDEVLAAEFLNAGTEDERLAAEIEIYRDIGRQVPSDWLDKWNAARYIAMLANLRTHGRNILGNAFFAPVVIAKNLTATAIEAAVYRISGKKVS